MKERVKQKDSGISVAYLLRALLSGSFVSMDGEDSPSSLEFKKSKNRKKANFFFGRPA